MCLYVMPAPAHVVAALVLDGLEAVLPHPAGEDLLVVLRDSGLEDEDRGRDAHPEEEVLRHLDDLAQAMVPEDAPHLCPRCLLELLVRQDEGAGRAGRHVVEDVLHDVHAAVLPLVGRVHEDLGDAKALDPGARRLRPCVELLEVGLAVLVDEHVRACEGVDLAIELDAVELVRPYLPRLGGLHAARLRDHVRHGLDEEAAAAAAGVEHPVVLVDLEDPVHEVGDVLRREDLPRL